MTARNKTNRKSKSSIVRKRRQSSQRSSALNFEMLEARQLLAAITVSNATDIISATADTSSIAALVANDGGDGISLREAITAANNTMGEDAITFDAAAFTGGNNNLIRLTQGQLTANDGLSIDGVSVGGVLVTGDADGDDITVFDSNITDVEASFVGFAGAADDLLDDNSRVLDFSGSGDLTLTGLTITGGRVTADDVDGGGIRFNSTGTLLLDQSTVSGNSTSGSSANGGGISSAGGNVSLTNSTISGNSAQSGGGIYSVNGVVSLNSSTINGNDADLSLGDDGGGIFSFNGVVSLTNSTISGNRGNQGGGIFSDNGVVFLSNSTINGNSTSANDGGGIYISNGNLSLSNSTVSGNTSNSSGGGISAHDSTVLFVNSTVTANTARFGTGNGILFSADDSDVSRLTIHNSIVADNLQGGNFAELRVIGDVTPDDIIVENSLIGRTFGSLIDATTGTGNILDQSALLSPLADYGGATQTHALLRASPAIDAGSNILAVDDNGNPLATDQRGESRVLGTVDIGAFELGSAADFETQSLVVNISQDIADPNDGLTSLREAIRFADDLTAGVDNDGDADGDGSPLDTITFDSSVFTGGDNNLIRLTQGQLEIRDSLAIDGSSVGGVVITGDANDDDITVAGTDITDVSASFGGTAGTLDDLLDDNSRVFDITAYRGRLILSDLTITGGRATDGSSFSYTSFDYGNSGGAIRASFGSNVSLTNSTVSGNSTVNGSSTATNGDGGGIFADSGRVSLTNSTVSGNSTGRDGNGGGISGGYISLTNSIVTGNSTGELGSDNGNGDGGGIFSNNGSVALNNSVVSGNSSNDSGGGIASRGDVSLANSTVSGNSSGAGGGGISAGDVSLRNSAVSGNVAGRGGGGISAGSVLSSRSTVNDNSSAYGGGGISAGDVSLTNSTVSGNVAGRDGGGIRASDVSLTGSTVSGNVSRSRYGGGGISSRDGNVSLTNSTVSSNASDVDGGGIRADGSTVLLINSTVTGNTSAALGGGIRFGDTRGDFSSDESLTLYNSIVASNGDDGTAPDIFASLDVMNVEHSLIGDITGFGITATTGTGNILNQLALLGPLADNGGLTQTHALLAGSPALDAGRNAIASAAGLTTDQRGETRIEFGTVDIGAFEAGVETNLIVTTNLDVTDQSDGLTSLREAIALANSDVALDTILFDPSVFDSATTIIITSQLPTITNALTITGPGANLLSIDAQAGGDNVFDGIGFRIFEVNDGDLSSSINVSISGLTLTGGDISAAGGAISNFENLILDAVSIVDNQAFFGGGVSNESLGVLSLTNSTIADNQASLNGGGIWTSSAVTAINVTISGNNANSNGAAIASAADSSGSTLNLTNVTLTNNMGNSGVYFNNASGTTIATFNNTIVDSSVLGLGSNGSMLTGGYNLFATADPGISGISNLFNQTSMLGPLADNGGSTLTHALLVGSPAYNAGGDGLALDRNGNLLLTDQRGERRNQFNTVDVGAVESEFDGTRSLVVTTLLDVDDPLDGLNSLREAIAFAGDPIAGADNNGDADGDGQTLDTITFDASVFTGGDNSVIRLTQGELVVNESLRIDASSVGGVVVTGDADGDDVTLPGTNITDVSASFGGTINASDDLLDDNSRVLNFLDNRGDLTLTELTITGGSTSGRYLGGGGIRFGNSSYFSGSLTLNQSIVSGNSVFGFGSDGGGIYAQRSGALFLINSTVSGNYSYRKGGAIHAAVGGVSLSNSTLSGNVAGDSGGAIYTGFGDVSLTNSIVSGNRSAGDGGGIFSRSSYLLLAYSTVSGNISGGSGGGISNIDRDVLLSNSTVSGNVSDGSGGGIFSRYGDVSLTGSTVSGNTTTDSEGDGGGVYSRAGILSFTNSTVSGNVSEGSGGGIGAYFGNVALTNSTVSGNSASDSGGGIESFASPVLLVNSTVTANLASGVGGGISIRNASSQRLTLHNSIIAGNGGNRTAPDLSAASNAVIDLTVENSLIGNTAGSGVNSATGTGNILNQSALLGPLADNGGPTQTHALLPGSPAIDAGNDALAVDADGPLTTDQRGVSRLFDARGMPGTGIDIGAFELRGLFVDNPIDEDDGNIAIGDLSLREALGLVNGGLVVDVVAFEESVFTGDDDNVIRLTQGELVIENSLNIDGTSVGGVVITGDVNGDDATVGNTNVTDVSASFGGTAGAADDLLDDNSRVINFSVATGDLTLAGLTITGGRTTGVDEDGGGIRFDSSGTLELNESTLSGNSTTGVSSSGGGIHSNFGDVSLVNSTLSGNSTFGIVSDGGAINTSSGDVSVINSTLSGNSASGNYAGGGGIHTNTGSVTLINSTLSGSRTNGNYGDGGGIFAFRGDVSLVNSTLSDNSTTGPTSDGGGIGTSFGNVSVVNSTLSGNSASGVGSDGGGISTGSSFNDFGNSVSLVNSTLTGNSAFGAGGGVFVYRSGDSQPLTISNSIVASNFDNETAGVGTPNDLVPDPDGVLTINHSLIGVADNLGAITGDVRNLIGTQAIPLDPLLGPLADNGGPTLTQALLPDSPAIDAGSNALAVDESDNLLTTDQRGENRFLSTVDIGAFELIEVRSLVVTTSQDIVDPNDGLVSLREAIAVANDPTAGINNDGDADGDGLASDTITFEGSVFLGGDDNVIRLTQGELVIGDSLSIDASSVGGVLITGDANEDDVTLSGTEITDLSGSSSNLLDDNTRALNFSGSTGNLTLTSLTVTGGQAGSFSEGGGIRFGSSGVLTLSDSTISGNSGYFGGGVYTNSGNVSVASSTISGNRNNGYGAGGGIYSSSGNVLVTNSTLSGNNSYGGGGIRTGSGSVSLNSSTISGNSTRSFDGVGAISTVSGNISVTNSTISGNSNVDIGGGISTSSGDVSVVNSTIVGNSGGGVSIVDDRFLRSSLRIVNSIVAGNFENSNSSTPLDLVPSRGDVLRIDHSLIGVGDNLGTITGNVGNLIGSLASPLDPLLEPLADNGGSTLTHALLPGSPAIGAGDNALTLDENGNPLTTDQTGGNRFVSTVDLGAVESEFDSPFLLGDASLNGEVNFLDIAPFISLLASNTFLDQADVNRDGSVNFLDISPFITLLASGSPS